MKHVCNPFYKAGMYGMDPNFTVTLNHKDYIRYASKYPVYLDGDMVILFWVDWPSSNKYDVRVNRLSGVWSLRLSVLDAWIRSRLVPCHEYIQRRGLSDSNAKHSWLIDLRRCQHEKPQV